MPEKIELSGVDSEHLFDIFKEKSLIEDMEDGDNPEASYSAVITLRTAIEIIRSTDDPEGDSGEMGEIDPALEIIYELAPRFSDEVIEEIIEGLFAYYLPDDMEDEDDEPMFDMEEGMEEFEEDYIPDNFDALDEKVSAVQKKRLRFLKNKRRKQLGKRGNSVQFKRTHHFDNKKKRFVKRKKTISVSAMRKKARIFKKTMKRGGNKAKAKRMKKRLKNVKNPYKH